MRRPVSERDAIRSQVIDALEAQEIKETGNEEDYHCGDGEQQESAWEADDRFGFGDRSSWYCVLDESGTVLYEQKLSTTAKAMKEVFAAMPPSRMALETGMHSPWVSRLLSEVGHEVIVAHARNVRLIGESRRKDDRLDQPMAVGAAWLCGARTHYSSPMQERFWREIAWAVCDDAWAGGVQRGTCTPPRTPI